MLRRLIGCLLIQMIMAGSLFAQHTLVLKGGIIIPVDSRKAPFKGTIVIQGSLIKAVISGSEFIVPTGGEVIDITGKYVIPGIIDAHAHVSSHEKLAALTQWGVTTILNPNESLRILADRQRVSDTQDVILPNVLSTGPIIGHADMKPFGVRAVSSPEEARAAVQEMKIAGVDAIKVFYDDLGFVISPLGVITPETMRTLIEESHRVGLKAVVHAPVLPLAREVLEAGADVLLHSVISDSVDKAFVRLMLERSAIYIPTLAAFEAQADISGWGKQLQSLDLDRHMRAVTDSLQRPETFAKVRSRVPRAYLLNDRLPVARYNLKRLSDAGIPIVMGTDTGVDGVLPGISSVMELVLEVEAGLTPMDAIRSATINAARALGIEDSAGSISPGKQADLVVLNADPLKDIHSLARIHRVFIRGRVVPLISTAR